MTNAGVGDRGRKKTFNRLYAVIAEHIAFIQGSGCFVAHRRSQVKKKLLSIMQSQVNEAIEKRLGRITDLDKIVSDIYEGRTDSYTASRELLNHRSVQLPDALRVPSSVSDDYPRYVECRKIQYQAKMKPGPLLGEPSAAAIFKVRKSQFAQ